MLDPIAPINTSIVSISDKVSEKEIVDVIANLSIRISKSGREIKDSLEALKNRHIAGSITLQGGNESADLIIRNLKDEDRFSLTITELQLLGL